MGTCRAVEPGSHPVLGGAVVAVVVLAVADLVGTGVDLVVVVVAVQAVAHMPCGRTAGLFGVAGIAVAVAVTVCVVGGGHPFIDAVVAVVVLRVTDLGGVGVDRAVGVVAVRAVAHMPGGRTAGLFGVAGIAVAIDVIIGVVGGGYPLIDGGVAVVVDLVADLRCPRVDRRVSIVTVRAVGDVAAVGPLATIAAADIAKAVAIAVAVPGRARVLLTVAVVAVAAAQEPEATVPAAAVDLADHVAVVVVVLLVAGQAATQAVVELTVAELRGARVDRGVGVIAVRVVQRVGGVDSLAGVAAPRRAVGVSIGVCEPGDPRVLVGVIVVAVTVVVAVAAGGVTGLGGGCRVGVTKAIVVVVVVEDRVVDRVGLVDGAVAVLVQNAIAKLELVGVHIAVVVIAVVAVQHVPIGGVLTGPGALVGVSKSVQVHVGVVLGGPVGAFIDQVVAVLVRQVADLSRAGKDPVVPIVAVPVVQHGAAGRLAGEDFGRRVSVAVVVLVAVDGHQVHRVVVDDRVTVVVDLVAELVRTGVDRAVGVVAVIGVVHVPIGGIAGLQALVGITVAILVVVEVPGFRRVAISHRRIGVRGRGPARAAGGEGRG